METGSECARLITDTVREPLVILDTGLHIIAASRAFYQMFRLPGEATSSDHIFRINNEMLNIPALRTLLESVNHDHESIKDRELRHRFDIIGEKVLICNAHRIISDQPGHSWILLAIEDVTGKIDHQTGFEAGPSDEELRRKTAQLEATIDSIPDGYIVYGPDRSILRMNTVAEEILGFTGEERHIPYEQRISHLQVQNPSGEPFPIEQIPSNRAFNGETIRNQIMKVSRPDRYYWLSVSAAPIIADDGSMLGVVMEFADITERKLLEKQLEDERDFVAAVIQTSGALIIVIDMDGNITRFNKASEELTGYTADEVTGRSLFDLFIPPEEHEAVRGIAARLFAGERRVDFENHWVTRSGEKRFIRWRNSILLNDKGEPVYAVATGIDITDRKRSEEALRKSEEQVRNERNSLNRAQEIAHLGSWELDLTTNRLTWSDEIYRIFGLQPQEFGATYEAFLDHVHRDDREAVDSAYTSSVQKGLDSYEIEHRVIRKINGEIRYVHEKCQHVRDSKGHIIRSIGMVHDITERKRAEEELLESRERFAAAFRTVRDALILSDLETGRIIDVNQTWISHWGYSMEETIGHLSTEMGLFTDKADRERLSHRIRKEGKVEHFEVLLRTRSGEIRHAVLYAEQLMLPNQSLMFTIIHDITERKRAENVLRQRTEELAAANRELEAFSYSVSHDLRTPLATIHGFSNLILENYGTLLDENGKGFLNHIKTAADKMAMIIDDLLKMAKISRETMACLETDLSPIAHSIIDELQKTEPHRNVLINIDDNMPVFADPGFMTITLTNLIGNAWKYTGRNQEARIDIGVMSIQNETVYFIRDNGAGFDMKFAHKLFKPFERLHPDSEFTGTGIGLTIVDKIIKRHGGRIWAESEPGKGSAFYFTINCQRSSFQHFGHVE